MKKNILVVLLGTFLLTQTACEDNKSEFLSDFGTILSFRNSGDIPLTLYKTGENTDYTITVNKSGSELGTTTQVSVSVMDEATLKVYNAEHGTAYKALPTTCYTFQNAQLQFSGSDLYKALNVELITTEIDKLAAEEATYVLPFEMHDSADSINAKRNIVFIRPTVITPKLYFDKTGYQMNTVSDEGAAEISLALPIMMPLPNKWTFDSKVDIDNTLLTEYNKENDVDYSLLPAEAYTMNADGIVAFTPVGASVTQNGSSDLKIKVKRDKLQYGNYVLPLRLKSCTHPTFLIDESKNSCLFGVSYVPAESKLSRVALTESMISIYPMPAVVGDGEGVAGMIDGKEDTFFHSNYNVGAPLPHYIQVKLPKESTAFIFEYQVRHNNNNGAPQKLSLYGSVDGTDFKKITTITDGLPSAAKAKYKSVVLVGKSFKYLRVSIEKTASGNSFALGEFGLYTN